MYFLYYEQPYPIVTPVKAASRLPNPRTKRNCKKIYNASVKIQKSFGGSKPPPYDKMNGICENFTTFSIDFTPLLTFLPTFANIKLKTKKQEVLL